MSRPSSALFVFMIDTAREYSYSWWSWRIQYSHSWWVMNSVYSTHLHEYYSWLVGSFKLLSYWKRGIWARKSTWHNVRTPVSSSGHYSWMYSCIHDIPSTRLFIFMIDRDPNYSYSWWSWWCPIQTNSIQFMRCPATRLGSHTGQMARFSGRG